MYNVLYKGGDMKKLVIYAAAAMSLSSVILHLGLWKALNWPGSLQGMDNINGGLIQMLNIVLVYMFLYLSVCTFIIARTERTDMLSRSLLLFAGGVPFLRIVFGYPLFGYSYTELVIWIRNVVIVVLYGLSFYYTRPISNKIKGY